MFPHARNGGGAGADRGRGAPGHRGRPARGRKRLHQHRDALRRAEHFATLGRLAAGLSHEIRNPLGALFLHIDLLEEEFREPTPESPTVMVQTFGEIRTALTRLDALVQDYLSLVRVGTIELDVQDLGAAVQAWTAEMQSRAEQQGVTVELEGHATVGPLAFHPSTLRRAVLNVVQNAIEAMPEGGTLRLECARTAAEVHVRIHDSGIGMPASRCRRFSSRFTPPSREELAWASILCGDSGRAWGTGGGGERGGAGHHLYPDVPHIGVTTAMRLRRGRGATSLPAQRSCESFAPYPRLYGSERREPWLLSFLRDGSHHERQRRVQRASVLAHPSVPGGEKP